MDDVGVPSSFHQQRTLIISPNGGMGNRFRALCSAIVLSKHLGRTLYHAWTGYDDEPSPISNVRDAQRLSLEHFLNTNGLVPRVPVLESAVGLRPHVDVCFSEWVPGQYWFHWQSDAYRHLGGGCPVIPLGVNGDASLKCTAPVVLLETSLCVRLTAHLQTWNSSMMEAYARMRIPDCYTARLAEANGAALGVSVRASKSFTDYFPLSVPSIETIAAELRAFNAAFPSQKVVVFSDIPSVETELRSTYHL